MAIFNRLRSNIINFIDPKQHSHNKFNQSFYWGLGGGYTAYDTQQKTYIEKGYNINPFVYSIVNQMATKTASIPLYIKKVEDHQSLKKLKRLRLVTGNDLTIQQKIASFLLETKAFDKDELPFPLHMPNHNQTWVEFKALFKTFIKTTGNVYIYMLTVEEGKDAGTPLAVYLLPSQNLQIVLKDNANMLGLENPVKEYLLIEQRSYTRFESENVIHIKYANPNYDTNGRHLYGQSPLEAALKNIQSSNVGLDLNIKTLKSGGAFGFIHGKNTPITVTQAAELKERLVEMNNSPENLGKIAGVSADMAFTRISLTSDELKPFDYLAFDEKQIANVFNWTIDDGKRGDFGGTIKEIKKSRVTDNIIPDLNLLVEALNKHFLPRFKGYENTVIEYDVGELPEMQDDLTVLSEWLYKGLDRGTFNRNEIRSALRWVESSDPNMEIFTVQNDIMTLEEAIDSTFNIDEPNNIDPNVNGE